VERNPLRRFRADAREPAEFVDELLDGSFEQRQLDRPL